MCVFQKTSLLAGMEKNALQNFSEFHQNITALQSLLKESSIDLSSGCLRKSLHQVGHRRRQPSQFLARRFKSPFPSSSLSLYPTAHVRPVLLLCWTTAYSTQPEASEMAFPPISERAAPCNWLAEGEKLWLWKQKSSSSKDMQRCWVLIYFYPFKYYLILDCCWVKKNHSRRYFQLGKIIDIVNSDTFLCVVIKDSWVVIIVFRRSCWTMGKLLFARVMWKSIQYLTEQKQTEEILVEKQVYSMMQIPVWNSCGELLQGH